MTIRHLKIFIAVAETGKMSAAAINIFISQPTVSQAIKELEKQYGILLFERISKKLYITEAGGNLLTYAKIAVKQFDEFESMKTLMKIVKEYNNDDVLKNISTGILV